MKISEYMQTNDIITTTIIHTYTYLTDFKTSMNNFIKINYGEFELVASSENIPLLVDSILSINNTKYKRISDGLNLTYNKLQTMTQTKTNTGTQSNSGTNTNTGTQTTATEGETTDSSEITNKANAFDSSTMSNTDASNSSSNGSNSSTNTRTDNLTNTAENTRTDNFAEEITGQNTPSQDLVLKEFEIAKTNFMTEIIDNLIGGLCVSVWNLEE